VSVSFQWVDDGDDQTACLVLGDGDTAIGANHGCGAVEFISGCSAILNVSDFFDVFCGCPAPSQSELAAANLGRCFLQGITAAENLFP